MTVASPEVSLDPALRAAGDVAHFWRVPRYHGLDCLRATFRRHAYARHTHETYAVAGIVEGCETLFHRGEQRYVWAGSIAVVAPDEVHDGAAYGELFAYRTFYPSPELMRDIAEDLAGRPLARPPWFPDPVMPDPELVAQLVRLHACLEDPGTALLERDERLVAFLGLLIARWGDLDPPRRPPESRAVARARAYLDGHLAEEVELADLARVTGLSRSHLIRAFRRETGLTPHAYLMDRRCRAAARRLGRGEAPGDVAAACGFFDQSHLNRVFKARMAVTPGAFRAA
jgi:AraC-like DNA-binding protein